MDSYADLFLEPTSLPPHRPGFDHRIPLKEGTKPFNLRCYRYSAIQKNIVDKLVAELLEQGVIKHITSPFASPTILVTKQYGPWRLYVDFRRLNSSAIKDRFLILIIEDLMRELGGATIFSKPDLRSGYQQVRMDIGEENKTAFKTHGGHFE